MKFTQKQQYELLASISARGEIPVKFVYLGEGAKQWDKVYSQWESKNGVTGEEMTLLLKHMGSFVKAFEGAKGVNLVDLGCGNGAPAIQVIKALQAEGFKVQYIAVDISQEMLELAESRVLEQLPELSIIKIQLDFEKESLTDRLLSLKQESGWPTLMINLGNTLGNYVNVSGVLTNFLESMTLNDYLLLGNGLVNNYNPKQIIKTYDTPVIVETVTAPAKTLGIYGKKDTFSYIWNPERNRLEGRVTLSKDRDISLADQTIKLREDEEILVHHSYKFSESTLTKLLSDVGFRTEILTTNANRNHILALVQPTRYNVA
jgi:uncharacterized SAM-dependent methyltransferase